jgi:hypothetical protein
MARVVNEDPLEGRQVLLSHRLDNEVLVLTEEEEGAALALGLTRLLHSRQVLLWGQTCRDFALRNAIELS